MNQKLRLRNMPNGGPRGSLAGTVKRLQLFKKVPLLVLLLIAFSGKIFAQISINLPSTNPMVTTGWLYGGTASVDNPDGAIQLTTSGPSEAGYIYYNTQLNVTGCQSFSVEFDYRINNSGGCGFADGIAFFFIDPLTNFVSGGGLGLPNPLTGLVFTMDTWDNDGDHLNPEDQLFGFPSANTYDEGDGTHRLGGTLGGQSYMTDGNWHHVKLTYNSGSILVYLNGSATSSMSGSFTISTPGYFGFSGSTGCGYSDQYIRNVQIVSNSINPITGSSTVCVGATTTLSDASTGGTWSSSDAGVAAVDPSTGVVTGVSGGTATITYTATLACGPLTTTYSINVPNYTITASAGSHGSISPSGISNECPGSNQTYAITADPGYRILNVLIDGYSVGTGSSQTFATIGANHTISASFEADCSFTYSYTGAAQTYTVPDGITSIDVVADGAAGGKGVSGAGSTPGMGGQVSATIAVVPGQVLNIYVGGKGGDPVGSGAGAGGYNGGAAGGSASGGGGGGTDIRSGGTDLSNRILVAGGGGGTQAYDNAGYTGGAGGGLVGGTGIGNDAADVAILAGSGGAGGTQSAGGIGGISSGNDGENGALGLGGAAFSEAGGGGGGGGGGYYGGGGGSLNGDGGGGSSYADPLATNVVHTAGFNVGNGSLLITPHTVYTASVAPICQGGTTAALGGSFSAPATGAIWSDGGAGGSFANNDGATPGTATYTASSTAPSSVTLTLTPTGAPCSSPSESVTLVVNPLPNIAIAEGSNVAICAGTPMTLDATGGTSYSWSPTDGLSAATGSAVNANPASTTTYVVTGSDGTCSNTASVVVNVNPLPVTGDGTSPFSYFDVTGGGTYCAGGTGAVVGQENTEVGVNYQLYLGGVAIGAPVAGTGGPVNFGFQSAAGTYTVVGTNVTTGCTKTMFGSATVAINPVPDVTVANQAVCNGNTQPEIDFSGTVPGTSFSWANDNTAIGLGAGGATGTVCGTAGEYGTLTLSAPPGAVFTSVEFASYGTPAGSCGSFVVGGCDASSSMSVVKSYLLGNNTATIPVNNATFNDPCYGTVKTLAVSATWAYTGNIPSFVATNTGGAPISGTITVTPTANGCAGAPKTFTITANPLPDVTTTPANVSCNTANDGTHNDGQVTSSVTDLATPYTYSWSNGTSAANATGLTIGSYSLTVSDANGCQSTSAAYVDQPTAITYSTVSASTVSCNSANGGNHSDGTATVNDVTGGTGGYGFAWDGGQTSNPAINLGVGTINVTISDANHCSTTGSTYVDQPSAVTYAGVTSTLVSCNTANSGNHSDGTATVLGASGGAGGYTYAWDGGQTTNPAVGLAIGLINVTVSDANHCTATGSTTVNQPTAITYTSVTATNVSCNTANGGNHNNGTATVNGPTGGTGSLSYLWSDGAAQITNPATGLAIGTYGVTIKDANSCSTTGSATVNQPSAVVFTTHIDNVSCFGGYDGHIDADASGGTPFYSYSWTTGGAGFYIYDDLYFAHAGNYTVTVTDAHSCTATATYTVTQPAALTLSATTTNVSCHGGSNGSITTTVGGGTLGYSYSWSGGLHGANPTGVSAGTYYLTVTDAHGCSISGSYTITQPATLSVGGSVTNVTCNGGTNGSITSSVTGGTTPYGYLWSPGGATTANLTGKSSGTYSLTVTDGAGCTASHNYTITQPSALTVGGSVTNVKCFGGATGAITTSVGGGVTPYHYAWTPGGAITSGLSGKTAGAYSVVVTDGNGCTAGQSFTITQPAAALSVTGSVTNVSCYGGSNGSITTTVTGGTSAYSYSWTPCGGSASGLSGKSAGTYNVTVTDANSCTTSGSYTITQPAPFTCSIAVTPGTAVYTGGVPTTIYLGYGPQTATLTATASGGTGLTYSWSSTSGTGSLSSTHIANPVFTAGLAGHYTYVCTITNSNGCTTTCSVSMCVIDAVDHAHSGHVLLCHAFGCSPSTLSLTPAQVLTHFPSHCPSDHLGPVGSACAAGREGPEAEAPEVVVNELTVTAYPNPYANEVHVKIQSTLTDNADVILYDITGRTMESKLNQQINSDIVFGQNLTPGIYVIEVRQGSESRKVKVVKTN